MNIIAIAILNIVFPITAPSNLPKSSSQPFYKNETITFTSMHNPVFPSLFFVARQNNAVRSVKHSGRYFVLTTPTIVVFSPVQYVLAYCQRQPIIINQQVFFFPFRPILILPSQINRQAY